MSSVSPQRCRQYSSTFAVQAAPTAKFLAPMAVRVRETYRVLVSADRSGRRPATDDTRTQSSVRQDGARPWRHLKTISACLLICYCFVTREINSSSSSAWQVNKLLNHLVSQSINQSINQWFIDLGSIATGLVQIDRPRHKHGKYNTMQVTKVNIS